MGECGGCGMFLLAICVLVFMPNAVAQSGDANALDALLQNYAYQAFFRPRTGRIYDSRPPANLSGIELGVIRLKSGSLRTRGVSSYKEFVIPTGVIVTPYVERLVLVYQNLGNWSSLYYDLPGYSYLTPVLGLLAYDAANLSAVNLPVLNVNASSTNISIRFSDVRPGPEGLDPKCLLFGLHGLPEISDPVSSNVCSTSTQGHFAIAIESTASTPAPVSAPAPAPPPLGPPSGIPSPFPGEMEPSKKGGSRTWKIIVGVIGGFIGLILLALLAAWLLKMLRSDKMAKMEQQSDTGEALKLTAVGDTRAPMAMGTRTPPVLENEYAP